MKHVNTYSISRILSKKCNEYDCVVRSISAAFDISYDEAYELSVKWLGHVSNQGIYVDIMIDQLSEGGEMNTEVGRLFDIDIRFCNDLVGYTLQKYISENIMGRYIVNIIIDGTGHTFALIDDILYGNPEDIEHVGEFLEVWEVILP